MRVIPGFGESSGYPSVSQNDNPTKYLSPVPIIKPTSGTSETTTKDPSHVPRELKNAKPSNMLM